MADANITLVCPSHGKLLSSVERCHTRKDILSAHPEDSGGGSPLLFTVWPSSRRPRPVSYALCFNHPQDPSPPYHGNTERTPLHGFVTIRHPGYDRVLFIFPAHDLVPEAQLVVPPRSSVSAKLTSSLEPADSSGSTSLPAAASEQDAQRESLSSERSARGIYHRLVLDACQITTSNQKEYLATDIAGLARVPASVAILTSGTHYLHLTTGSVQYKIVADFAAWEFPQSLPLHWRIALDQYELRDFLSSFGKVGSSAMSDTVKQDDAVCVVSGYRNCVYSRLQFRRFSL